MPSADNDDTTIAFSNIWWTYGIIARARAWSAASLIRERSGRLSRSRRASSLSSSRNGSASVDIAQAIASPSLASCFADSCQSWASYGGTSSRSSKNASSIISGVAPGMRAPSTRVSDSGLYG